MAVTRLPAVVMAFLLASCGGGGGGGPAPTSPDSQQPAGGSSGNGNPPSTDDGSLPPAPSPTPTPSPTPGATPSPAPTPSPEPTPAPAPAPVAFVAQVSQAPDDGARIRGTVRILVEGDAIENVELLPANGYAPLLARGVVNGDKKGAYIDFDTTVLPDGPVYVRVAAFNASPGQSGSEITAMAGRTWTIENSAAPAFSAQLVSAPETTSETFWLGSQPGGGSISPTVRFEVSGTGLGNVELVSANDPAVVYGRFTIAPDGTHASLDWDYTNYNGWHYGVYVVRVVAWDAPAGQPGQSIEVMAPRTYYQKLSLGCQAEGRCGGTAP